MAPKNQPIPKKKKKVHTNQKGPNVGAKKTKQIQKTQKPKNREQFEASIKTQTNEIKNKQKRIQVQLDRKHILNSIKSKERKERKKLPKSQRAQPITIEDKQIGPTEEMMSDYEEAQLDEFNKYLNNESPVKILLTTSIKPPKKVYPYLRELMMVFHNVYFYPRADMKLENVYEYAKNLDYTHVMVVRYSHGFEILIKHLQGMMAVFKITSIEFQKQIKHHAIATDNIPQLILNNFDSKVGVKVGRLLASLFPQQPEFKGRRVVTFHNQRDFVFFRHHRYIFTEGYEGVNMQEIGPRFTMKVKKVYCGEEQEDTKDKGLIFHAKDNMYSDRKAVYL